MGAGWALHMYARRSSPWHYAITTLYYVCSEDEPMSKTNSKALRKGARVETSGKGRTARWRRYTGTVTKKRGASVFVVWDGMGFEDQMDLDEVRRLP